MTILWLMYFELGAIDSIVKSRCPAFFVDMEPYSFIGIKRECLGETVRGGSFMGE